MILRCKFLIKVLLVIERILEIVGVVGWIFGINFIGWLGRILIIILENKRSIVSNNILKI